MRFLADESCAAHHLVNHGYVAEVDTVCGAKAALALVLGKEATIQAYDTDDYGRTIADVFLPDGLSVNQQLVREGWCWWYREYAPGDTVLGS